MWRRDVSRAAMQQIYDVLSTSGCRWILRGAGAAAVIVGLDAHVVAC